MQVNERDTKQSDTIGKCHEEPLAGTHDKCGPVIPSYCGEHVFPGKLKNPVPAVKSNT